MGDYLFAVSSDLFEGSVLDVAAFEEDDEELVDDGVDHGTYLVGLGFDFEVFVVRVADQRSSQRALLALQSRENCNDGY